MLRTQLRTAYGPISSLTPPQLRSRVVEAFASAVIMAVFAVAIGFNAHFVPALWIVLALYFAVDAGRAALRLRDVGAVDKGAGLSSR